MFGLLIGHTHDDIEASFERWNLNLYEPDYPTILLLMESNIDMKKVPIIPHMIEELSDWRVFVNNYISDSHDKYFTYIKTHQFKFYL